MVQFWLKADCTTNFHGILTFKENAHEKMVMVACNSRRPLRIPIQ